MTVGLYVDPFPSVGMCEMLLRLKECCWWGWEGEEENVRGKNGGKNENGRGEGKKRLGGGWFGKVGDGCTGSAGGEERMGMEVEGKGRKRGGKDVNGKGVRGKRVGRNWGIDMARGEGKEWGCGVEGRRGVGGEEGKSGWECREGENGKREG